MKRFNQKQLVRIHEVLGFTKPIFVAGCLLNLSSCNSNNAQKLDELLSKEVAVLVSPVLEFNPTTIEFGEIKTTELTSPRFELVNSTENPATLATLKVVSDDGTFTLKSESCDISANATIAAKSSCFLTVVFKPSKGGKYSGLIETTYGSSSDKTSKTTMSLTGSLAEDGEKISLGLTPAIHDFGQLIVATDYRDTTFTIANDAAGNSLYLTSIGFDANSDDYTITANTCPAKTVAFVASATCTVSVRFAPTTENSLSATLQVLFGKKIGSTNSKLTAIVTGQGSSAATIGNSALKYTPTSTTFTSTSVGSSRAAVVNIENGATRDIYLNTILMTGSQFTVAAGTCPIAPNAFHAGDSCNATVTFIPTSGGQHLSTFKVNYGLDVSSFPFTANSSILGTGVNVISFPGLSSISNVSSSAMTLNWGASANAIAFLVYEVISGAIATPTTVLNTGGAVTTYRVTGLSSSSSHIYRVRAVNALGEADTNESDVTQVTDAVGSFTAGSLSASEGQAAIKNLSGTCTDSESNAATYAFVSQTDNDANCSLSGTTLTCTPAYKVGHANWSAQVSVSCTINESTVLSNLALSVTDSNRSPSLANISDQSVAAGGLITAVNAADGGDDIDTDNDTITYTCTFDGGGSAAGTTCASLPGSPTFTAATGQLSWQTNFAAAVSGVATNYTITITGSDGQSSPLTGSVSFVVEAQPASSATISITNSSPTASNTLNLSVASVNASASRYCMLENNTSVASCTWTNLPVPSTFTATATDGNKKIYLWLQDSSGSNTGRADSNTVVLDTTNPVWTASPSHDSWSNSKTSNPSIAYSANATDSGSGVVRYEYAIGTGTSGATLNDIVTWTTAPSSPFSATISGVSHGETYYVNMRAVDGISRTSAVNSSAGWVIDSPNFTGLSSTSNVTTRAVQLNWSATSDALAFNIYRMVNGAMTNPATVTNTAGTVNSYAVSSLTPNTTYIFRVRSLGSFGGSDSNTSDLSVTTDAVGTFTNGALSASEGQTSTLNLATLCSDGEGNTPTTTISSQSDSDATCTVSSNTLSCTPAFKTGHSSWSSQVNISCALNDSTLTGYVTVSVADTNQTPTLVNIGNQSINAGNSISSVDAATSAGDSDGDGDALTYSCTFSGGGAAAGTACSALPGSAAINVSTGAFTWQSNFAAAVGGVSTVYTIIISGSDGQATPLSGSKSFTVTVAPAAAPTITVTNSSPTSSTTLNLTWGSVNASAVKYCVLENDTDVTHCSFSNVPVPSTYTASSTNGSKTLSVWVQDSFGSNTTRAASNAVVLDTDSPTWASTPTHAALKNSLTATPTISYTSDAADSGSGVDHYEYAIGTGTTGAALNDVKAWTTAPATGFSATVTGLADASTYYVNMRAVDGSGLTSSVRSSTGWVVDVTGPTLTVTSPTDTQQISLNTVAFAGACETGRSITVTYDSDISGSTTVTCTASAFSFNATVSGAVGNRSVTLAQTDAADNTTSTTRTFERIAESVSDFAVGTDLSCLITTNKKPRCWGSNIYGQVGNGLTSDATVPTDVSTVDTVASISVGTYHGCYITEAGAAKCWGYNAGGRLGDGSTTNRGIPVQVTGLTSGVTKIYAGDAHSCALVSGGIKCWGTGLYGRLGNAGTANSSSPVDVTGLTSGVSEFVISNSSGCALKTDGSVYCWGYNDVGQVGNGDLVNQSTPVKIINSGATKVFGSTLNDVRHFCALVSGALKCWGKNTVKQLGDGTAISKSVPTDVSGLSTGVSRAIVGSANTCAIMTDATAMCWGTSSSGQLGNGATTAQTVPQVVTGLTGVTDMVLFDTKVFALTSAGVVYGWGANTAGKLGDGTVTNRSTATAILGLTSGATAIRGYMTHICARKSTGGLRCWGDADKGQLGNNSTLPLLTQTVVPVSDNTLIASAASVAVTDNYACALTTAGAGYCWGLNTYGSVGNNTTDDSNAPAALNTGVAFSSLALSDNVACGISTGGAAYCWGYNTSGTVGDNTVAHKSSPTAVTTLTSGVSILKASPAAIRYMCAIATIGGNTNGLYCWGQNNYGQLGVNDKVAKKVPGNPTGLTSGIADVALTAYAVCALTSGGAVSCWGLNTNGQVGNSTTTEQLTPTQIIASGISGIYSGKYGDSRHFCAITSAGGVKCWGKNTTGQLGIGSLTDATAPTDVSVSASAVTKLALGEGYTCALITGGSVKCWGYNVHGELGDNSTTQRTSPVDVSGLTSGVADIYATQYRTCARLTTGAIKCWGYNLNGQVGDGTVDTVKVPTTVVDFSSSVSSLSNAATNSCGIQTANDSSTSVKCFGYNDLGQLGQTQQVRSPATVTDYP